MIENSVPIKKGPRCWQPRERTHCALQRCELMRTDRPMKCERIKSVSYNFSKLCIHHIYCYTRWQRDEKQHKLWIIAVHKRSDCECILFVFVVSRSLSLFRDSPYQMHYVIKTNRSYVTLINDWKKSSTITRERLIWQLVSERLQRRDEK